MKIMRDITQLHELSEQPTYIGMILFFLNVLCIYVLTYFQTIGAAFGSKKEIINGKPITLGIWVFITKFSQLMQFMYYD